jgi:hypothetical protein
MSHIPITAGPTEPFSPDALGTFIPENTELGQEAHVIKHPEILFLLRIPTWADRDLMAMRMYSLGVREVGPDQIRALMISELYTLFPDDNEADEAARFMEGFWQRQQNYVTKMAEYEEQEALRRGDALLAKVAFEAAPQPVDPITPRERSRAALLQADVIDCSERLRNKLTDQQLYNHRYKAIVARLTIAGWMGLKTEAAFETRASLDAPVLTKETIEALRGELMELDQTGAAWDELTDKCERMFDLPRGTEKNSSSPAGSSPPPAGSTTSSTESASSDGSSTSIEETDPATGSSSEQIPDDTSLTITETLSVSSPASDTETSRPSPTDERSHTSPSD